jgi:ABC-type phosphate/phosphonate transport system substrate-binding protein
MGIERTGERVFLVVLSLALAALPLGCAPQTRHIRPSQVSATQPAASQPVTSAPAPASQPAVVYDTTVAKPIHPRDFFERWTLKRGADFRLVDRLMDPRTRVPEFDRQPLAPPSPDARLSAAVPALADTDPFPPRAKLGEKAVTVVVGIARSTYRTREPVEVISAAQPFIDLVQREVDMRGAPELEDTPEETYYALLDGRVNMQLSHVFDYLLVHTWFESVSDNGTILLSWAAPANPYTTGLDSNLPGVPGTSIVLVVARDATFQSPADLKGARLSLAANYVDAPGAFLTRMLQDLGHPLAQPFFGRVTLRRYVKDALIDLVKGKADVACVDEGTLGALARFYGLDQQVRPLAVSPRYNIDVLYTSQNNLATHRTEIELTQRQLTTLAKNAEGQEVLFLFDVEAWYDYRPGELDVARAHFADFVTFVQQTPVDLKPLLDPNAPIDRRTYDRYGDE